MAELIYDGKEYELKYNLKRLEMIEGNTSLPTMAQISRTGGYFGISDLKVYISMGLKEKGADVFVMPRPAGRIAEAIIEQDYKDACASVLEALERDCPFFFPKS